MAILYLWNKTKLKLMKKQIQNNHTEASNLEASIACTIIILICLFGNEILNKLFF